jgi:small subunit ribosomal protein S17
MAENENIVAESRATEVSATTEVATSEARGRRKERVGKVVSDKMDKTIIVTLTRQVPHPLYKKYFKKTTKFVAHDEKNDAKTGDTVRIMETRPLSKTKRWRVVEVLERAK